MRRVVNCPDPRNGTEGGRRRGARRRGERDTVRPLDHPAGVPGDWTFAGHLGWVGHVLGTRRRICDQRPRHHGPATWVRHVRNGGTCSGREARPKTLRGLGLSGVALAMLLLAACGRSANDQSGASQPPWGLDGVTVPSDESSVRRVLEAMPDTVGGQERLDLSPDEAAYEQMRLRALRLGERAQAEGLPPTARAYLERLAESGEIEIETRQLDPETELVYLTATTTANGQPVYVMAWGEPESEWVFSLSADSADNRVALVNAFVVAVTTSG